VAEPVNIALFYDGGGYVETLRPPTAPAPGEPVGLMGRQVAGKEFLDAYLGHGTWAELTALVRRRRGAEALARPCQTHPSSRGKQRRLRIIEERHFFERFFPDPPARLLYAPHPPDTRFAWARQHGGATAFALCGVTHTLSSAAAARQVCEFVTAPYEPYDALICTSRAVARLVRTLADTYADYLRERHGGALRLRPRLEMIPLGVDTPSRVVCARRNATQSISVPAAPVLGGAPGRARGRPSRRAARVSWCQPAPRPRQLFFRSLRVAPRGANAP
jgi:hypothetical protein